jgi:hypothetical protein
MKGKVASVGFWKLTAPTMTQEPSAGQAIELSVTPTVPLGASGGSGARAADHVPADQVSMRP